MIILDDSYIATAEQELNMDFSEFRELTHLIVGSSNKQGVIGFELHEHMTFVTFAYSDGTFKTHKELIEIMRWAYEFYTIDANVPIYYTGLKNVFPLVSLEVSKDVYQYIPKQYLNTL